LFLLHQPNVEDVSIVLFLFHRLYYSTNSLHHLHFLFHIYCAILQQMAHHFLSFIVAHFVAQNRSLPPRTLVFFSLIFCFCWFFFVVFFPLFLLYVSYNSSFWCVGFSLSAFLFF
jgi:hypothetical protein